ncbi:LTO1 family protein [Pseudocercospora fuligena]|uniref:LTO1 family protein n=1 Tax=Pseudocercospora fuligena TaxID=685502 RepID=A0A8H6RMS6_9PEZI|nr:LTO1 family protein [Pseudocercospora fuligena]
MTSEGQADVFEDALNLEDQYYREGYDLGVADGSKSGRIEGRVFGLEKGFEKFIEMGKLSGKAAIWEARLLDVKTADAEKKQGEVLMPKLGSNERLRKHIERLATLTNPDGVSTENSEDAVSEFDDRLKDAKAKATLISRIIGEDEFAGSTNENGGSSKGKALRLRRNESDSGVAGRRTGEMEDFLGLPGRN